MKKLKINVEYWGAWNRPGEHSYKITQIIGAPVVDIAVGSIEVTVRVGDLINEKQAIWLSDQENIELKTVSKAK